MPRVANIDIPAGKRVEIALTYIFGIGRNRACEILTSLKINFDTKAKDLTPDQVNQIQDYISETFKVEGDLRRETNGHIQRLVSISCYRGIRHRDGLPVRGQLTRNKGGKRREKRRKRAN